VPADSSPPTSANPVFLCDHRVLALPGWQVPPLCYGEALASSGEGSRELVCRYIRLPNSRPGRTITKEHDQSLRLNLRVSRRLHRGVARENAVCTYDQVQHDMMLFLVAATLTICLFPQCICSFVNFMVTFCQCSSQYFGCYKVITS